MKYIKEVWSDEKHDYVETEITKEEAVRILSGFYNHAEDLVEVISYYRLPYGGIEVVEA